MIEKVGVFWYLDSNPQIVRKGWGDIHDGNDAILLRLIKIINILIITSYSVVPVASGGAT